MADYANYRQIPSLIASRRPFEGNTMDGRWEGDIYRVWSYSTVIAEYQNGVWYLNTRKYSVTTSRQQNLIVRAISSAFTKDFEEHGWSQWV